MTKYRNGIIFSFRNSNWLRIAYAIGLAMLISNQALPQVAEEIERSSAISASSLSQAQLADLAGRLASQDRQLILQTIEYLKQIPQQEPLRGQVKALAESAPDSIVQGYARLLAADWGISLAPTSLAMNFKEDAVVAAPINSSFADSGSSVGPNPTVQLSDSSGAQPNRAYIGQSMPTPIQSWSGASAQSLPMKSSPTLKPQSPFWASSASFENSIPADAGVKDQISVASYESFSNESVRLSDQNGQFNSSGTSPNNIRPQILDRTLNASADAVLPGQVQQAGFLSYDRNPPLGFTGPSGVVPTEFQTSDHFVPIEDRWRLGFPSWDRYGTGHVPQDDYPYKEGSLWDPYNQNVLKGDFPIIGQHTFYSFTAESLAIHEYRQTPTATTPFESTRNAFSGGFFGNPNQLFYAPNFKFAFELFHGNEAFKPIDWKIRLMPVINANVLDVNELAVVNPDVRRGTQRTRGDVALEEYYVEAKLADIGPDYDFVSARVGSQFFVSDFRGFVFRDVNRGARLFGTRLANRDQFNLVYFDQAEKDTNSGLNTFGDRHQNVVVANYFRQDFVFPGYTGQASFHYNNDKPSTKFDNNDNLVRPDPVGIFKPHEINAYYLGAAGEGHIGRINILNQFYVVLGQDSANPIGGTAQNIFAQMGALELSYDRDWIRFRTSYFFASGDDDPNDGQAGGFDTILDDPIFAGGEFSYWQRQAVRLFGTNLTQGRSLVPNLRSSKTQGQSNFVNPGLHLFNFGTDIEVTPKARLIANTNYLFFDTTEVLQTYTFQDKISREIGLDMSLGLEYRPLLNDNAIIVIGVATLLPDQGLKDLFGSDLPAPLEAIGVGNELRNEIPRLSAAFVEVVLTY